MTSFSRHETLALQELSAPASGQAVRGIEAHIDEVGSSGLVRGWARDPGTEVPLRVELWVGGMRVAGACAVVFRRDLLLEGHGHGHYGFQCHIICGAVMRGMVQLRSEGSDLVYDEKPISLTRSGKPMQRATQTIESLLAPKYGWSVEDVASAIDAFDLSQHLADWGLRKFIALSVGFLCGRWPTDGEYMAYADIFRRESWPAKLLFQHIMNSEECRRAAFPLISPYDGRFPFAIKPAKIERFKRCPSPWNGAYLSTALLVSRPWSDRIPQLDFDERLEQLLCHPPATGVTVARITRSLPAGVNRVQVQVSLGHPKSHPVEFAIWINANREDDGAVIARFESDRLGLVRWHRVARGMDQILEATCAAGTSGGTCYIATRMASGAENHHFAWARFLKFVVNGDVETSSVSHVRSMFGTPSGVGFRDIGYSTH